MEPRTSGAPRRSRSHQVDGPNWILIAGSTLLSALSIRLGYKIKQVFDAKQASNSNQGLKVNGKSTDTKKSGNCRLHANTFCFTRDEDGCFSNCTGSSNAAEIKQQSNIQMSESEMSLPLVTVPTTEFNRENCVMWSSSPDHLQLPQKAFHHSNSSDSPCVSESGSDLFTKREVVQKLRQQLKRRDDMILEMQDQISELQNSLNAQLSSSSHLQSLIDASNRDLFESEREIQRLRKAIADHCVNYVNPGDVSPKVPLWTVNESNGHTHANGYPDTGSNLASAEKVREGEMIEILKREVKELKELIEGKDYLLHSYKEQKSEFSVKIKELQERLDSQLPNIL